MHDDGRLVGLSGRVAAEDRITEGDRAIGDHEPVEDVATPVDVATTNELRVRMNSTQELVHDTDPVRHS